MHKIFVRTTFHLALKIVLNFDSFLSVFLLLDYLIIPNFLLFNRERKLVNRRIPNGESERKRQRELRWGGAEGYKTLSAMIELGVLKAAGLKVNSHTQINRHTAIIYTPDVQKCPDKGGTHTAQTHRV